MPNKIIINPPLGTDRVHQKTSLDVIELERKTDHALKKIVFEANMSGRNDSMIIELPNTVFSEGCFNCSACSFEVNFLEGENKNLTLFWLDKEVINLREDRLQDYLFFLKEGETFSRTDISGSRYAVLVPERCKVRITITALD